MFPFLILLAAFYFSTNFFYSHCVGIKLLESNQKLTNVLMFKQNLYI